MSNESPTLFQSLQELLLTEIYAFSQSGDARLVSQRLDGLEYRVGLHPKTEFTVTLTVQFLDDNTVYVVQKDVSDSELTSEWADVTAKNMAHLAIAKYELSRGNIGHINYMIQRELAISQELEKSSTPNTKPYFSGKVGVLLWLSTFLDEVE